MARPIKMKDLDEIVENGGTLQFVGVGKRGMSCDFWIAVGLPPDADEEAYVLVASNSPNIRTLLQKAAATSIVERYPDKKYIQTLLLPLAASIERPDDIYLMTRAEIEQLDPVQVLSRRLIAPDS
jgi:hypothetical protein